MEIGMTACRLALIALLWVAMDFAVPPLSGPMDGVGEFEELLHRSPGWRSLRIGREPAPSPPSLRAHAATAPVIERAPRVWSAGPMADPHPRKLPPPDADSATVSDDH